DQGPRSVHRRGGDDRRHHPGGDQAARASRLCDVARAARQGWRPARARKGAVVTAKDFDDRALPPGELQAPAPSNALLNAVQGMKPVRTRTRFGAIAAVALLGLIWPAVVLTHHAYRPDLGALPLGWVIGAAALWGAAFVLSLTAALVPRRGDVLPAPGRASRVGGVALA